MDAATLLLISLVLYLTIKKRIGVYISLATTPGTSPGVASVPKATP